jgi:hypothetical protein
MDCNGAAGEWSKEIPFWAMPEVKVLLSDWDHDCCGDLRRIGDHVMIRAYPDEGRVYEQRHFYSHPTYSITGRVISIAWLPRLVRRVDGWMPKIDGYGPPVLIPSTLERPEGKRGAFEFTIETASPYEPSDLVPFDDESRAHLQAEGKTTRREARRRRR